MRSAVCFVWALVVLKLIECAVGYRWGCYEREELMRSKLRFITKEHAAVSKGGLSVCLVSFLFLSLWQQPPVVSVSVIVVVFGGGVRSEMDALGLIFRFSSYWWRTGVIGSSPLAY